MQKLICSAPTCCETATHTCRTKIFCIHHAAIYALDNCSCPTCRDFLVKNEKLIPRNSRWELIQCDIIKMNAFEERREQLLSECVGEEMILMTHSGPPKKFWGIHGSLLKSERLQHFIDSTQYFDNPRSGIPSYYYDKCFFEDEYFLLKHYFEIHDKATLENEIEELKEKIRLHYTGEIE